jgi:hypothetical protein
MSASASEIRMEAPHFGFPEFALLCLATDQRSRAQIK